MFATLRPALVIFALLSVVTGVLYPATLYGLAQALFPQQANGSLIVQNDRVIGSSLIGQSFTEARYFQGRPSAAGSGYDAANSSGSNLGPTSQALAERIAQEQTRWWRLHPHTPVPADLLTASGSGLDPHISPEAAAYQVDAVARARGLDVPRVQALVQTHTAPRTLGVLGEPTVHVLNLNRALDALQ